MIVLKEHLVPESVSKIRLVYYALQVFSDIPSKSGIKKAIKRGEILIDGEKTEQSAWVKKGQTISWINLQNNPPKVFEFNLEVIFEDDYIAVINKPAGISVSGNKYKTIVNTLSYNLQKTGAEDALKWPLPVHRLDYPTSGLLLIAKTRHAQIELGTQFEKRKIRKTYNAIIYGQIATKGLIDMPLDGQVAITEYQLQKIVQSLKATNVSLLELYPLTGRTHQIRRHLAEVGHPIIGDSKYIGDMPLLKGKGLFLAATGLEFTHPVTKEKCVFQINMPHKFSSFLEREERRWKKYHQ